MNKVMMRMKHQHMNDQFGLQDVLLVDGLLDLLFGGARLLTIVGCLSE